MNKEALANKLNLFLLLDQEAIQKLFDFQVETNKTFNEDQKGLTNRLDFLGILNGDESEKLVATYSDDGKLLYFSTKHDYFGIKNLTRKEDYSAIIGDKPQAY